MQIATLKRLWPNAPDALIADIAGRSDALFEKYHLSSKLHVGHFMAQISHECGGGTVTTENLSYSSAARIAAVWPKRFTVDTAAAFVRSPKALANKVYNGRMGNRVGSDDGWNYRGRGLLQLTGREAYQRIGDKLGIDLVGNPALAAGDAALEIALLEFVELGCLPYCTSWDDDALKAVTKRVNGGLNGIDDRRAWLAKWKATLADDIPLRPVPQPASRPAPPPEIPKPAAKSFWEIIGALIASMFKR